MWEDDLPTVGVFLNEGALEGNANSSLTMEGSVKGAGHISWVSGSVGSEHVVTDLNLRLSIREETYSRLLIPY